MFWPHGYQAIRRHCVGVTISTRTLMNIVAAVSSIGMWSLVCLWMSCLQSCQVFHRHSADPSTEYCFIRVPVATCTLMNIVAHVWCIWMWSLLLFVVVLAPWLPGHLQTQCWSPNWLVFCQGFSIHVYPGRHCGSCFICTCVIFIVPVDVLPHGCQAICRHNADHPNGLFC